MFIKTRPGTPARTLGGYYSQINQVERMMPNDNAVKRRKPSFNQAAVAAAQMLLGKKR